MLSTLVVISVAVAGCGDDGGGSAETQPAPDVTTFVGGDFGDLPLPPLAEEAGPRSEQNGVVVQSYFVRNRTAAEILDFYETYFKDNDVPVIAAPERFGKDAWRGSWLLDGRELLVAALPAPTATGEEVEKADVVTQLSLELSPADGGGHQNDPATLGTS